MRGQLAYCMPYCFSPCWLKFITALALMIVTSADSKSLPLTHVPRDDNTVSLTPNVSQQGSIPPCSVGDCFVSPLQYSFFVPGEGTCGLLFLGAGIRVTGDRDLKIYIRYGQRVDIDGNRIVADYVSESASRSLGIDILAWSSPPLRGGTYFIAISNCAADKANYEIYAVFLGIDLAGPVIFGAEVLGERLIVYGFFLGGEGELFVNGKRQKHVTPDEQQPGCVLIGNKAGKKISPGETVTLRVRFPGGYLTPKFKFSRPLK